MEKKSLTLVILLGLLVVSTIAVAYYRFIVVQQYVLEYEVACDPAHEECFIYECDPADAAQCAPDYYKVMRKYASDVSAACGATIVGCEAAGQCLPTDTYCETVECDSEQNECSAIILPDEYVE